MGSNLYSKEKSRYFESVMRKAESYDDYRKLLSEMVNVEKVNSCATLKAKAMEVTNSTIKLFKRLFGVTYVEIEFTTSKKEIIDAKIVTGPTKLPNLKPLPLDVRYFVADSYLKMFPSSATAKIVLLDDNDKISIMKLENDVKQSNQEPYCETTVRCWYIDDSSMILNVKNKWM